MEGFDATAILTAAVADLGETFTGVATPAIGLGIAVFGLMFGWSLVRRFVS